ncbi:MAG: RluA family pseudouridine synthase [Oscillospiraceae bacterium]|jgi:23S rRNA-/tRNA-specific pseudouridylate synthase|nr:RluA family pseudouridine synthase [Oscillospiraceae bacterium]
MIEFIIPDGAPPMRADRAVFLYCPSARAGEVRSAFNRRDVKRNGERIPPHETVARGDHMAIYGVAERSDAQFTLDIIYEDKNIIIINKPQGMSVEPDAPGGFSLADAVRARCGEAYACHRLDYQTGGLTLFAKNMEAYECAADAFRRSTEAGVARGSAERKKIGISKAYHCQTVGTPEPPEGELLGYLIKDAKASQVRVLREPSPGARLARTRYRVLTPGDIALVEAEPLTGRTHQIRAQLADAGVPILGDDKYGNRPANREARARTQRLWSVRITFYTNGALDYLYGKTFRVSAPFDGHILSANKKEK